jgi:hypothetical protein
MELPDRLSVGAEGGFSLLSVELGWCMFVIFSGFASDMRKTLHNPDFKTQIFIFVFSHMLPISLGVDFVINFYMGLKAPKLFFIGFMLGGIATFCICLYLSTLWRVTVPWELEIGMMLSLIAVPLGYYSHK